MTPPDRFDGCVAGQKSGPSERSIMAFTSSRSPHITMASRNARPACSECAESAAQSSMVMVAIWSVILTSAIGAFLLKHRGFSALVRVQRRSHATGAQGLPEIQFVLLRLQEVRDQQAGHRRHRGPQKSLAGFD